MFSINAARCGCASQTTDPAFQISSLFMLHDSLRPFLCRLATAVVSTTADSWLKWAVSFDEESRARHIPAEGDR
jgi:hypothetical protein